MPSLPALLATLLLIAGMSPAGTTSADPFPLLRIDPAGPDRLEGAIKVAGIDLAALGTGEEIRIEIVLHGGGLRIEAVMERDKPMSLLEVHVVEGGSRPRKKRLVDHAALMLLERQLEGQLDDSREMTRVLLTFVQFLTRRLPVGAPFPTTVQVP